MLPFLLLVVPALATAAPPAPCCINHKFSAEMFTFGAAVPPGLMPTIDDTVYQIAYDYDLKMIASRDEMQKTLTVFDYNTNLQYTLVNGSCYTTNVTDTLLPPCIPDDAEFDGTYALGSQKSAVTINTYRINVNDNQNNDYVMKIAVTDDCTPVSYSTYGMFNGVPAANTFVFSGITLNALPAGTFDIPIECIAGHRPNAGLVGK